MDSPRIHLFGKFEASCCEQALVGLDAQKPQELFCYLAVHRGRPHHREALADLLWAGSSAVQSRKYLRRTLWQLKAALACPLCPPTSPKLLVDPEWIQLNTSADVWLDIVLFEQAFSRFRDVPGRELNSQGAQILQKAADLYRGDLLENWYQDWCLCERERFRNIYRALVDKLIGYCEVIGHYEAGLVYAACILRYDRARERTHRQLMRLHYLSGDRTTALRQYEQCVIILDKELRVAPTKRTTSLYKQIRLDQLDAPARKADEPSAGSKEPASALPKILDRLDQIHAAVTNAQ